MKETNENPAGSKTPEEVEYLKRDWEGDPCYELEDVEGFEAHREELLAFRQEKEKAWEAQRQRKYQRLAEQHGISREAAERVDVLTFTENLRTDQAVRILKNSLKLHYEDAADIVESLVAVAQVRIEKALIISKKIE